MLSHQYDMPTMNKVPVDGLIIAFQLKGTLIGRLEMREPCVQHCSDQNFQLAEGEALLFTSKVWSLFYNFISDNDGTITFIQEIDLK